MKLNLIATVFFISLLGCTKKLSFTTAPQLKFESLSTSYVPYRNDVVFTFSFTDKEGDIADSSAVMWIEKNIISSCPFGNYQLEYGSIYFPDQKYFEGQIDVGFTNGINGKYPDIGQANCSANDTCIFRFVLKDRAGNISDTVVSPQVVIEKNL